MSAVARRRLDFFADENFSKYIAQILAIYAEDHVCENKKRFHCTFHENRFPKGTPDETWIPEAAKMNPKPVILGGDGRILTNPVRLACLKDSGLHFVCLVEGYTNLSFSLQVQKVLKAWDEVCQTIADAGAPSIFEISQNSRVKLNRRLADVKVRTQATNHA